MSAVQASAVQASAGQASAGQASAGQAFVGIDAGTTGCTVMIFDENGNRLGQGYQEYPFTSPRAGWIEQDAEQVWNGICAASRIAVGTAALPASAYRSVGFSSQRGTILMLDENKNNLTPSVVWNDGRARMVVDAFQSDIKGGITDLRLTGGGTKSDGFAQIMTDIIGQPTKVTRERECTVFGAAILGAFGSGAFSSIDEAVEAMVNVEGEFEPNGSVKELYDEANGIYRGLYESIAAGGQYAKLNEFSTRYF